MKLLRSKLVSNLTRSQVAGTRLVRRIVVQASVRLDNWQHTKAQPWPMTCTLVTRIGRCATLHGPHSFQMALQRHCLQTLARRNEDSDITRPYRCLRVVSVLCVNGLGIANDVRNCHDAGVSKPSSGMSRRVVTAERIRLSEIATRILHTWKSNKQQQKG